MAENRLYFKFPTLSFEDDRMSTYSASTQAIINVSLIKKTCLKQVSKLVEQNPLVQQLYRVCKVSDMYTLVDSL